MAKLNVYEIVTQKIIDLLSAGVVPWRRPWTAKGLPMNYKSRKPYRGIKVWFLSNMALTGPTTVQHKIS